MIEGGDNFDFVAGFEIVDGRTVLTASSGLSLATLVKPARKPRLCADEALSFATIVEHVAFEAVKTVAEIVTSRRPYLTWLRRVTVWLAHEIGQLDRAAINTGLAANFDKAGADLLAARQLYDSDLEFRQLADVVASALVSIGGDRDDRIAA